MRSAAPLDSRPSRPGSRSATQPPVTLETLRDHALCPFRRCGAYGRARSSGSRQARTRRLPGCGRRGQAFLQKSSAGVFRRDLCTVTPIPLMADQRSGRRLSNPSGERLFDPGESKRWVVSGSGSIRPVSIKRSRRDMHAPAQQSAVRMVLSPAEAEFGQRDGKRRAGRTVENVGDHAARTRHLDAVFESRGEAQGFDGTSTP